MEKIVVIDWKKYFPKEYVPRKLQETGITQCLKSFFLNNKKYFILESPVGTGKSFIATTIANYINSLNSWNKSYILTTQIILQNQYKREFKEFANISSKTNYICSMFKDSNCGDMKWLHQYGGIPRCKNCPYEKEKQNFLNFPISITNTAFFMTNLQYNQDLIKNRQFLAIDEAHNLQEEIIKYKSIQLEYSILLREYSFPEELWIKDHEDVFKWLIYKLYPWLEQKAQLLKSFIQNKKTNINLSRSKVIDISKKYDFLDKLICQLNRSLDVFNPQRWVVQNNIEDKKIKITPLFAYDFSQSMMFKTANKILLMSGTILNKYDYCQNLGISLNDCEFLSLDSPFPVDNRRIFLINSGSMSKRNIKTTLPFLLEDIKKILKLHQHQKGIIHVTSHYIAQLIYDGLKDPRLIITNDFNNRDQMLQYHNNSDNTVLISPSMMQGIDLKEDLSRFQIIAKVPFPNLGDKYIATKKEIVKHWYQYQTTKAMVQAYGRSIRSQQDYAVTYILDSDFMNFFYPNNKQLFPKYFREALVYGKL